MDRQSTAPGGWSQGSDVDRQLLVRAEGKLNLEMQTEVVITDTTIDDAFIKVQKGQCGAVYASTADLKALTIALVRNSAPYDFSSLWNSPTDVDREDASLAEKEAAALQEETGRRRRNNDQLLLDRTHQLDKEDTQKEQQNALRRKFGESAQAAAGALSSEIVAWTKDQNGQIGAFLSRLRSLVGRQSG